MTKPVEYIYKTESRKRVGQSSRKKSSNDSDVIINTKAYRRTPTKKITNEFHNSTGYLNMACIGE